VPGASVPGGSVPLASAAPGKAWFVGAWQGTFRAELLRIELPAGGVKEWKQDDGKHASGDGTVTLQVAADGTASGATAGALGDMRVTGRVEGDRAALTLASSDQNGFHGTLVATQAADGMQGNLNASSGDSLQVRSARVALTRAAQ
jgi:hypothetical protein